MFSWIGSYRLLLRDAQAKAAEETDPSAKAAFEQQAKRSEVRLKEVKPAQAARSLVGTVGKIISICSRHTISAVLWPPPRSASTYLRRPPL
jgi:hypothetical protein